MTNYVTITYSRGINYRPAREDDEAGEQPKKLGGGVLRFHKGVEEAKTFVEDFWKARGFKGEAGR